MPKAATTRPRAPKTTKQAAVSVSLRVGDLVFTSTGETIADAVAALKPTVIKSKCIISVTAGKLKAELAVNPLYLRQLLANPISRQIFQKRMAMVLK